MYILGAADVVEESGLGSAAIGQGADRGTRRRNMILQCRKEDRMLQRTSQTCAVRREVSVIVAVQHNLQAQNIHCRVGFSVGIA